MKTIKIILLVLLLFKTKENLFAQNNNLTLSITNISSDKLILNWQRIGEGNFTCEIQSCSGGVVATIENISSITLKDLSPNTVYSYKVKITDSNNNIYWTECKSVKTVNKRPF